jgi:IS1 family transposase
MGSVVEQKANRPWLWIATDAQTRQVMALHGGDRSRDRAKEVRAKMPLVH